MKKSLFAFLVLIFFCSFNTTTHARRTSQTKSTVQFRFTEDMVNKINKQCPITLKIAKQKHERLEAFCSIKNMEFRDSDLGPWEKMVHAFEKLFKQLRRLIYVAAVFMAMWIIVKAAYEGEMKWTHIGMLLIGVVVIAFAEVLIDLATNRVTLEDVIENGVYVDCRNNQTNNAYIKCTMGDKGAELYDVRYFLQLSGETHTQKKYKGIY